MSQHRTNIITVKPPQIPKTMFCPFTGDKCLFADLHDIAACYDQQLRSLCAPCRIQGLSNTLEALKEMEADDL